MASVKHDISRRIYIVFLLLIIGAFVIFGQLFRVQMVEGDYWLEVAQNSTKIDTIYGKRGDIYSADGKTLLTSLQYYKIALDPTVASEEDFRKNLEPLADRLAAKYPNKTAKYYRNILAKNRDEKKAYVLIDKSADFKDLQELKEWPLFNLGRYKGGFIVESYEDRQSPFGHLARRTLGIKRTESERQKNLGDIGLERSFDTYLQGKKLPISKVKISGGNWVETTVVDNPPDNGLDIYTTIDINIQDIAHQALNKNLQTYNAHHGSAIVMDVKTGEIKAIVNLGKDGNGGYIEDYNYAIAEKTNPGSTFKTAMLLSLLSDKKASLNTFVDLENGQKKYYDRLMKDDHVPTENEVTFQRGFEISSNVALSKMVYNSYKDDPWELINHLKFMNLNSPTGIEIDGESAPELPQPGDGKWSGVSLPWMGIGYEIELTPLQLLTFYNTVANGGIMMKPFLVKAIKKFDQTIEKFEPTFVKKICSESDADKVRRALRGVVLRGTARNIASEHLTLAGKTGTAIIKHKNGKEKKYQASFAGFFPAEQPRYSCIVVINQPENGQYYGSQVAAPVFKEIAEKIFAKEIEMQKIYIEKPQENQPLAGLPETKIGYKSDIEALYQFLDVPYNVKTESDIAYPSNEGTKMSLKRRKAFEQSMDNVVPNVLGMGLRDALFILENKGLEVQIIGKGKVIKQSLEPGSILHESGLIKVFLE